MAQVNMPNVRPPDDALTLIAKGLGIAKDIFGIKTDVTKLEAYQQEAAQKKQERQRSEDASQGIYDEPTIAEFQKTHNVSIEKPTSGFYQEIKRRNAPESPLYLSIRPKEKEPKKDIELGETSALRKEYDSLPLTKNTREILQAYEKIEEASVNESPTGTSDVSLIYNFVRMIDPTSSVKEGEVATVQNTKGVSESILGLYNRTIAGDVLTDKNRNDIINESRNLFKAQLRAQKNIDDRYAKVSQKFKIDPSYVVDEDFNRYRQKLNQPLPKKEVSLPPKVLQESPVAPKFSQDVLDYAKSYNISPDNAQRIKDLRTRGG